MFAGQVTLAAQRPVVALDLPSGADILALAAGVAAHLPDGPVVLFGASLGGLVGWALSRVDPRIQGLITLGSLPDPRLAPRRLVRAVGILRRLPEPVFRRLYRRRIAARLAEEGVAEPMAHRLLAGLPARDTLCDRLEAVCAWTPDGPPAVPTLWLRGQLDREISWDSAVIRRCLPTVGVEVVPGGHRAHLTHPTALNAIIDHFARSLG